jgi:hypothetical protein
MRGFTQLEIWLDVPILTVLCCATHMNYLRVQRGVRDGCLGNAGQKHEAEGTEAMH